MTTADHDHPEIEARLDRMERVLGRLVDYAEATNAILRDITLAIVRIEARLDRMETRLGSIEDALRGPGRN